MLLANFNNLGNKNEQDAYLMALISTSPAARHTVSNPRKFRMSSFKYKVRMGPEEINVCMLSFCSFHGISVGRVRRLQSLISANILTPKDQRGKHTRNRVRKTPEVILNVVCDHIASFKSRQSHYSCCDNPNTFYLPEDLSVTKMHKLFLEMYQIT